jgi:hypothetical protein
MKHIFLQITTNLGESARKAIEVRNSGGILLLLSIFVFNLTTAQIIPPTNSVDWSKAGIQSPFTEPANIVNIMNFGASANGITDDTQALNNAISALNGHYGVVLLPAGIYLLTSEISLPDSVIIRGEGSNSTFIKNNSTSTCFSITGTSTNQFANILTGFQKESNKITVDNTSLFQVGNNIEIRQNNGLWDLVPASWAEKVLGQITSITNIVGDTLFLKEKLRINFDNTLNIQVQKINPKKQISIEYLNIERTSTSTSGTGNAFAFVLAENCRLKGIESNKSLGSHCKISLSSHIEISGSYFHDAIRYDGVGTKGYGIALDTHASSCLITNNIFKHLRHAMMTKAGANGNVLSYNYSLDVYRNGSGEFPLDFSGDISLHGHYSFANLFEGNIVQNIIIDEYWGPSGPYNTFFRNRTESYGIIMSASNTNNSNFVGNELNGSFPYGMYSITGTNKFEYGNNVNNTVTPGGTSTLTDASCYLTGRPAFWNIPDNWPSLGYPNLLNTGTIPAKANYIAGNYTEMPPGGTTTGVNNLQMLNLKIYPNPATNYISIEYNSSDNNSLQEMTIHSLEGKLLKKISLSTKQRGIISKRIDVSPLPKGDYLLKVRAEKKWEVVKMRIE